MINRFISFFLFIKPVDGIIQIRQRVFCIVLLITYYLSSLYYLLPYYLSSLYYLLPITYYLIFVILNKFHIQLVAQLLLPYIPFR